MYPIEQSFFYLFPKCTTGNDIEKVIAQIGKPEVIEEQEEAYFSDKTANKNQDLHFLRLSKNNCSVTQKT